jgi:hypothetical protein
MNKISSDPTQEALDILFEISKILNCQLDKETLSILVRFVSLIEFVLKGEIQT